MQYSIKLQAGVPQRQSFTGKTLVILSIGAATALAMDVEIGTGQPVERFRDVTQGLRLRSVEVFTGATFTSATDCTIEVVSTMADVSVNYTEGATVTANIAGLPLPVSNDRGAPAMPVYVSGITYTDAPAVTLQDNAAVAVGDVAVMLVAADADRKSLRFTNTGADPAALGAVGQTWAKRCIVLASGDTWVEDRAANLAWYGVTDTGGSASITTQEVLA